MKYTFPKEKVLSSKRKNLTYFCGSNFKKKRKNYIFLKELLFSSKSIKNFILLHESDFKRKESFTFCKKYICKENFKKIFLYIFCKGNFEMRKSSSKRKKLSIFFVKTISK